MKCKNYFKSTTNLTKPTQEKMVITNIPHIKTLNKILSNLIWCVYVCKKYIKKSNMQQYFWKKQCKDLEDHYTAWYPEETASHSVDQQGMSKDKAVQGNPYDSGYKNGEDEFNSSPDLFKQRTHKFNCNNPLSN